MHINPSHIYSGTEHTRTDENIHIHAGGRVGARGIVKNNERSTNENIICLELSIFLYQSGKTAPLEHIVLQYTTHLTGTPCAYFLLRISSFFGFLSICSCSLALPRALPPPPSLYPSYSLSLPLFLSLSTDLSYIHCMGCTASYPLSHRILLT